jgi:hypothetical protein
MTLSVWAIKAWVWLRANWKWLILPVGVLLWVLGRLSAKKPPDVVAPELLGAAKGIQAASDKASLDLANAARAKDAEITLVDGVHSDAVHKAVQAQENKYEELKDKPEEVNSFLASVGKDIRKG